MSTISEAKTKLIFNPFDENVKRCAKGIHLYDRRDHEQCPDCKKESKTKNNVSVNVSSKDLYKKLWRSLCRDVARLNAETMGGKKLTPSQARIMLEYLKFLQEAKALDELEQMENKDVQKKKDTNPANRT